MSAAVMPWYTSVSFHTGFSVFFRVLVRSLFACSEMEAEIEIRRGVEGRWCCVCVGGGYQAEDQRWRRRRRRVREMKATSRGKRRREEEREEEAEEEETSFICGPPEEHRRHLLPTWRRTRVRETKPPSPLRPPRCSHLT